MSSVNNLYKPAQARTAEIALAAALRLARVQSMKGSYLYEYDAIHDVLSNKQYNMVRMAGATYGMCAAGEFFLGTRAGEVIVHSARKAVTFLLRTCRFAEPAFFVCDFSYERGMRKRGSTGATALLANALLFAPFCNEFEEELLRLIRTLLLSQTATGAIRASLHTASKLGSQRYYPGETLLALVRYGIIYDDKAVIDRVKNSLSFYQNYFSVDPHLGLVLWHVDCWIRMARLAHSGQDISLRNRCLDFCGQLLQRVESSIQRWSSFRHANSESSKTLRIGASTALYVEAISRYIQCCYEFALPEEQAAKLKIAVADGMYCLEQLQCGHQIDGQDVNERLALGGCRSSLRDGHIRMDNDQHLITACLAVIDNEYLHTS